MSLVSRQTARIIADAGVGAGAVSAGVWLQIIQNGLGIFMLVGGSVLLSMRLFLTYREIKSKKKQ